MAGPPWRHGRAAECPAAPLQRRRVGVAGAGGLPGLSGRAGALRGAAEQLPARGRGDGDEMWAACEGEGQDEDNINLTT